MSQLGGCQPGNRRTSSARKPTNARTFSGTNRPARYSANTGSGAGPTPGSTSTSRFAFSSSTHRVLGHAPDAEPRQRRVLHRAGVVEVDPVRHRLGRLAIGREQNVFLDAGVEVRAALQVGDGLRHPVLFHVGGRRDPGTRAGPGAATPRSGRSLPVSTIRTSVVIRSKRSMLTSNHGRPMPAAHDRRAPATSTGPRNGALFNAA